MILKFILILGNIPSYKGLMICWIFSVHHIVLIFLFAEWAIHQNWVGSLIFITVISYSFFLQICFLIVKLKISLPFLAWPLVFTSCPGLRGMFKSMILHEDSSQSLPKPPLRPFFFPSGCLLCVSSFPQQYGIPAQISFPLTHLVRYTVKHTVLILIFIAFFPSPHKVKIYFFVFL